MTSYPLPNFIRKHLDPITEEWRDFAETIAIKGTSDLVLRDHIHQILFFIADDIETAQTARQQVLKSHGKSDERDSPGAIHAVLRHDIGFSMVEMVLEYRALRASIIKLWIKTRPVLTDNDVIDMIRFNEAIDQLLAQSVASLIEKYAPKTLQGNATVNA